MRGLPRGAWLGVGLIIGLVLGLLLPWLGNAMRPDDHRRTVASYVSNAGIVLPLLRPHLLIAWAIALGLAAAGTVCIGVSQWLVKHQDD
jgi:hypothetical protein